MFTREQMKQAAKLNLKKDWGKAIGATFLMSVPTFAVSIFMSVFLVIAFTTYAIGTGYTENTVPPDDMPSGMIGIFIVFYLVILVFATLVYPVLTVGYNRFFMKQRGNVVTSAAEPFSIFKDKNWGNVVVVSILTQLTVFAWSLLLVIPGIIIALRYSMIPFILASNPTVSFSRAKQISSMMMKDKCGELVVLWLSFFGWFILAGYVPFLMFLYVLPYFQATLAEFYSCRRAELILKSEISPAELPSFGTDWYSPYNNNGPFTSSGYSGGFNQSGFNQGGFNQGFSSPAGMPFTGNNQGIAQGYGTPPQNQPPVQETAQVNHNNQGGQSIVDNAVNTPLNVPAEDEAVTQPQIQPAGNEPVTDEAPYNENSGTDIQ